MPIHLRLTSLAEHTEIFLVLAILVLRIWALCKPYLFSLFVPGLHWNFRNEDRSNKLVLGIAYFVYFGMTVLGPHQFLRYIDLETCVQAGPSHSLDW